MKEMNYEQLVEVEGGLGNTGKAVMAIGGAVVAGIAAPVAGAAVAAYGTAAVVTTVAGAMATGFTMMGATLD